MMNNDKPQLVERRGVYTNLNRLIFVLIGLLAFVIAYPVAEMNYDCPSAYEDMDANHNCIYIKGVLWETVFALSAFHGDGLPLTDSIDEQEGRSIYPLFGAIVTLQIGYILAKRKLK